MTQQGTVCKLEGDTALVRVIRSSACEGCHKGAEGCSACSLLGGKKEQTVKAKNTAGAVVGDRVQLEAKTGRMLGYAFLVFVFPIVLALICRVVVSLFCEESLYANLAAVAAFVLAFFFIIATDKLRNSTAQDVEITRVINMEGK